MGGGVDKIASGYESGIRQFCGLDNYINNQICLYIFVRQWSYYDGLCTPLDWPVLEEYSNRISDMKADYGGSFQTQRIVLVERLKY